MDFVTLGVASSIVEKLKSRGLTEATPIQEEAFPLLISGKALRILSKTGTGKTFAYVIPLVQKYLLNEAQNDLAENTQLKILVVVPTRELAFQVASSFEELGFAKKIAVVVGGENEGEQIKNWKHSAVAIATPGRLLDLLDRRAVDTSTLQSLVFDEADRLIDMGFIDDIRRIYARLPKGLHVLFASATMNLAVDEIGYEFGLELHRAGVESDELTAENLDHKIAYVGDQEKFHAVAHYVSEHAESRGIIFSNYRERAHDIAKRLSGLGWTAEALSAQLNQDQRNRIIESYRNGRTKVLVASDLASRGLDFLDIDYVINYDLPEDPSVYVHRVGRTARAGKKGEAVSLIGFNDSFQLEKLESFLGAKIEKYEFAIEKFTGAFPRKPRVAGDPPEMIREPRSHSPQTRGPDGPRPKSFESKPKPSGQNQQNSSQPRPSFVLKDYVPKDHSKPRQKYEPKTEAKVEVKATQLTLIQKFLKFFGLEKKTKTLAKDSASSGEQSRNRPRGHSHNSRPGNQSGGRSGRHSNRKSNNRSRPR